MYRSILVAFVSMVFLSSEGFTRGMPSPPAQAAGYSLVFGNTFTSISLSPDGSGSYDWYPGIWYEVPPEPFSASTATGVLDLAWNAGQSISDTSISSCSPHGSPCHAYRYGYFEARMRWDTVTGAFPAFWLTPVNARMGATEYGELDVFEGQGNAANEHTFFGTIHEWEKINGVPTDIANNGKHNFHPLGSSVDLTQWHTYGVLWVPGQVTWYFDNQPLYSAPTYPCYDTNQTYFVVLGMQEGADWSEGNMNGVTATTMNLYVDWVRVWQDVPAQ